MSMIQIKRGEKKNLPVLGVGEFALCTDTLQLFMGSPLGNIQVAMVGYLPSGIINQRTGKELKFWVGTKTQKESLESYDENTVYIISDAWLGGVKFGK